jgi:hypothetical protein
MIENNDIRKHIEKTIKEYQKSIKKFFDKNQKLEFASQEVPFRFKDSSEYFMTIVSEEKKESYIIMKVKYLDKGICNEDLEFFMAKISYINKKKNPLLTLGRWKQIDSKICKTLTPVKKNK